MNQEEFLSWIKNNSQWIISKLENLEDYENDNDYLKAGNIIISFMDWGGLGGGQFRIALIDSVNIYDNQEWVSYFVQTGYFKKSKTKPPKKEIILYMPFLGQPYNEITSEYLMEMVLQREYVVGHISETIKKPFLNWSQETPWKKSSSDQ